jgi:hypothetical protein
MEVGGPGWSGIMLGGHYKCKLSKSKTMAYDYVVDCTKDGGQQINTWFDDGDPNTEAGIYALKMTSNSNHYVRYNGNSRILRIGYFTYDSENNWPEPTDKTGRCY